MIAVSCNGSVAGRSCFTPGSVSTGMGDRIRVQLPVRQDLSRYATSHPGRLSQAIPSWIGMVGDVLRLGSESKHGSCLVAGKTV